MMNDLIRTYSPICKALAALFPNQIEVVLHDLSCGKIAYIENSYSNRVAGDDSLIDLANLEQEIQGKDILSPYSKVNVDGTALSSVTSILRNEEGKPVALMCINFKTEALSQAINLLSNILPVVEPQTSIPGSLVAQDWREQINLLIKQTLDECQTTLLQAKRKDKKAILATIEKAGLFDVRGSSNYVAQALGISRASLYEILRTIRHQ